MQIIPVIDLKNGQVVHAARGNRELYRPIQSPLCQSSSIGDVVSAFLSIYPFKKLYIADLNALSGTEHHVGPISEVLRDYPEIVFWIDAGFDRLPQPYTPFNNYVPVIGSESLGAANLPQLKDLNRQFILSLDFAGDQPMGADEVFNNPQIWPETVIIMTLTQVGSNCGPDFQKLENYRNRFAAKEFVAAGGIRNKEDLLALEKSGIHHSLIASALHSGAITTDDIASFG